MPELKTSAEYAPLGDQPRAIETLAEGLAAGDRYQTLIGATGTGKIVHRLSRHSGSIWDAEYSPDGRWIVTAGPVTAGLWDGTGEHFFFFLSGHTSIVHTALFEPDSRRIVTAGADGTVRTYWCAVCGHLPSLLALARERIDAAGSS